MVRFLRSKAVVIALFVAIPLIILSALYYLTFEIRESRYNALSDSLTERVRTEIAREKSQALSVALVISQNERLIRSVRDHKRDDVNAILAQILGSLHSYDTASAYKIQIADADLKVFVRTWDRGSYGFPLEGFRKGLVEVKKTLKPVVSLEVGKKVNIKAIVPLVADGKFCGTLEVIKDFSDIVSLFKQNGISLLVLMDDKYLSTAEWMRENARTNGFVVSHDRYDSRLLNELSTVNFFLMLHTRLILSEHYLIASEPMRDLAGERIGFFVAAIDRDRADEIAQGGGNISFYLNLTRDDLATIAMHDQEKQAREGIADLSLSELIQAKSLAPDLQKPFYTAEIKRRLGTFTKDEAIDLLLDEHQPTKKTGEIR